MNFDKLKDYLDKAISLNHFPGASYCFVDKSGNISCSFTGYKQLYPEVQSLEPDTIYDIASLTKVMATTTMILKLMESNQLHLDQKVIEIIDWVKDSSITIRQLMTHTSGLQADIPSAYQLKTREDVINKIKAMELINKPEEVFVYSDIGYILLGFIIEEITKKTLSENAKSMIFDPLKMNNTTYFPNRDKTAPTEYRDDAVYQGLLQGRVHDEKAYALNHEAGHAGLFSTAYDIGKFMRAVLQKKFVLNNETLDLLFETAISFPLSKELFSKRSIGWLKPNQGSIAGDYVDFDNTICHTGFTGCHMFIDRTHEIGFVLLSNAVHPKRDNNRILEHRNAIGNIVKPPMKG